MATKETKGKPAATETKAKSPAKATEMSPAMAALAAKAAQAATADAAVRGANGINVTFLSVCQKSAQALEEDNALYIPGLKQKDFYVNAKKLILGKELRVVPLAFISCYNENTRDTNPKFVGVWHKDDAQQYELDDGSYYARALPNNNILNPVTWVLCYLPDHPELERVVITFKSTAQKVSKAWQKDVDARAKSSCELVYNLSVITQKKDNFSWFEIAYEFTGKVYELKDGNIEVIEDFAEEVINKSLEYNEAYLKGNLIPRRSTGRAAPRIANDPRSALGYDGDDEGDDEPEVNF